MKRLNRIYLPQALNPGERLPLEKDQLKHILTVLKMQDGEPLTVFNGLGQRFAARLCLIDKKNAEVELQDMILSTNESPLNLHLYQGISRGDKMELSIQKSVELGVQQITPLFSERCGVKLAADRLDKKMQHWQQVIISACQQCERDTLPKLNSPIHLKELIATAPSQEFFLLLDPHQGQSIKQLDKREQFSLLIGPEGGFSEDEVFALQQLPHAGITLGPRILRTETAGLTVISLLQGLFGDF